MVVFAMPPYDRIYGSLGPSPAVEAMEHRLISAVVDSGAALRNELRRGIVDAAIERGQFHPERSGHLHQIRVRGSTRRMRPLRQIRRRGVFDEPPRFRMNPRQLGGGLPKGVREDLHKRSERGHLAAAVSVSAKVAGQRAIALADRLREDR